MVDQLSDIDKLETYFEDIIEMMERRFTSHEFFLKLAHVHQKEYVGALASYMENGTPFKDLHHELIKRLRKLEGKRLTLKKTDYPSRDIFGITSTAGLWQKKSH